MEHRGDEAELTLRAELEAARLPLTHDTGSSLKDVVCAFVDACKTEGWYAERVIIAVKQMVRDAGHGSRGHSRTILDPTEELISELVGSCIAHHYANGE